MGSGLWRRLRGARGFELFALLAVLALVLLVLLGDGSAKGGGEKTDLEARLERILSRIDGAGRVSAMVAQDESGDATGAVIVAEGLEDVGTYLNLQRAAMALLGLEPASIEIVGRDGGFGGGM